MLPATLRVGADITGKTFHMELAGGVDIRGRFTDAISADQAVTLPHYCAAELLKHTRIRYSTEKEEVTYHLLKLGPA